MPDSRGYLGNAPAYATSPVTSDPATGNVTGVNNLTASGTVTATALGYTTGGGTTGTQATSRTTSVALVAARNAGAITVFTAAPVVGTWFTFGVTGGGWAATDTIVVSVKSATNTYNAIVTAVGAGTCNISMVSVVGTASDGPIVTFAVVKAATT